jgi:phosphatidylinositol dimannoside acyltransferase
MGRAKDMALWGYWFPFRCMIQHLPAGAVRALAGMATPLVMKGGKGRELRYWMERAIARQHISPFSDGDKEAMIRRALRNYLLTDFETLVYPRLSRENIGDWVVCDDYSNLDAALGKGRGALLLFAHFGANQMIMPAIGYKGYKMSQLSASATAWKELQVARTFSRMEERAMELREAHERSLPVKHVDVFGSMKEAFLCLKRNEILGAAVDGGGGKDRMDVEFLGKRAFISPGMFKIAARTGCAVLPTFMVRDNKGLSCLIIEPAMNLVEGDGDAALKLNLQNFIRRLEYYVVRHPCHYLNFMGLRVMMAERHGDMPLFQNEST